MKTLKLTQTLKNLKGEPVFEQDGKTHASLRYVCCSALITPINDTGEEKFSRGELAIRLRDAGSLVNLTDEEIKLAKRAIGNAFSQPEIVIGAWTLLDAARLVEIGKKGKK